METFVARLNTSSITATYSALGLEGGLPSTSAAMRLRASVAFMPMVDWLIMGTLPISRLNRRVDFSASLMHSRKCKISSGRSGTRTRSAWTSWGFGVDCEGCEGFQSDREFRTAGSSLRCFGRAPRETKLKWELELEFWFCQIKLKMCSLH